MAGAEELDEQQLSKLRWRVPEAENVSSAQDEWGVTEIIGKIRSYTKFAVLMPGPPLYFAAVGQMYGHRGQQLDQAAPSEPETRLSALPMDFSLETKLQGVDDGRFSRSVITEDDYGRRAVWRAKVEVKNAWDTSKRLNPYSLYPPTPLASAEVSLAFGSRRCLHVPNLSARRL